MGTTKIEWTDRTWNPITGCSPVSEGCAHCYAARMAKRLAGRCGYPHGWPFCPGTAHEDHLDDPLKWKKPTRVFVCSMGDLFHGAVKYGDIMAVWQVMAQCQRHTFMVLTKRPERMHMVISDFARFPGLSILPNVWLGVTAENQARADERIPILLQTPAAKRFVSYEPALGAVEWDGWLRGWPRYVGDDKWEQTCPPIDWLIAGAETGPKARPAELDWFRDARDQCADAGVPFFLKKVNAAGDRMLDGAMHEEWPEA